MVTPNNIQSPQGADPYAGYVNQARNMIGSGAPAGGAQAPNAFANPGSSGGAYAWAVSEINKSMGMVNPGYNPMVAYGFSTPNGSGGSADSLMAHASQLFYNGKKLAKLINEQRAASEANGTSASEGSDPISGAPAEGLRQGSGVYPGGVVTDPSDTNGVGMDFAIKGGEGAEFFSPFVKAEVLEIQQGGAADEKIVKGSGRSGYGNYVKLKITLPDGTTDTVLIAHFVAGSINPDLKKGMVIGAGTYIGKQGMTGSTTGPHISMDFGTAATKDLFLRAFRGQKYFGPE